MRGWLHSVSIFLVLLAVAAAQQPNLASLITVKDPSGAVISNADITIVSGKSILHSLTDTKGQAAINVPSGNYDITVKASGFLDRTQRVSVAQGPIAVNFELLADPRMPGPMGDDFSAPVLLETIDTPPTFPLTVEVKDITGAPVPNADVRLVAFPHSWAMNTDARGVARFDLMAGDYQATVFSQGFFRARKTVKVNPSVGQKESFALKIGYCSPCIEVQGAAPSHVITVNVKDESGKEIDNADVGLVHGGFEQHGITRQGRTTLLLGPPAPQDYEMTVVSAGFIGEKRSLNLESSPDLVVNVTLAKDIHAK